MTHREEPLFDPRLADWLEDDPHTAPDQVLDIVLAAIPSIRQRRTWREPSRFLQLGISMRMGLTAAAVLIAALGGLWVIGPRLNPAGVGGSQPPPGSDAPSPTVVGVTPTPSAAAPSVMSTFTSPQYDYTVEHPTAYVPTPATEPWPAGEEVGNDDPWVDRFFASQSGAFVGIASQRLAAGTDATEWMAAYAEGLVNRTCSAPASAWTDTSVDGVAGRRLEFECGGFAALEIVWVVGDRGWVITGDPPAVVELMLRTFEAE